jgi:hypothetical protein
MTSAVLYIHQQKVERPSPHCTMTPSRRQPLLPPSDDPHAITRRRLARLMAIGAVRAALRQPTRAGDVGEAPTTGSEPANNTGIGDALAG